MKRLLLLLIATSVSQAAISITTTALPPAYIGIPVGGTSWTLVATGGTAPYTWTIDSGTLPAGLSLSTTGVISGTATTLLTPVNTEMSAFATYNATSLSVESSSGFTFPAIVKVGGELIYCAVSFASCTRGFEGTPVSSHTYYNTHGDLVSTSGIAVVRFKVTDAVAATATVTLGVWPMRPIGLGCTTSYVIDRDCDGYGLGSPVGPDADDTDSQVTTKASFVTKWGAGDELDAIQKYYASTTKNYGAPLHWVFIDVVNGTSSCNLGQTGDDANSNLLHPCQTWAQAKSRISSGDAAIWRTGTYVMTGADTCGYALICSVAGTSTHTQIHAAYPGEQVTMARNVAGYHVFGMVNAAAAPLDYWSIDGFHIVDYLTSGITGAAIAMQGGTDSTNGAVRNNDIWGFYDQLFLMSGYQNMTIEYNITHDTYVGGEHNWYLQAFNFASSGLVAKGNVSYRTGTAGNNFHVNGRFIAPVFDSNIIYSSNSDNLNFEQGVYNAVVQNNVMWGATNSAIGLVAYWQNSMCPAGGYNAAPIHDMSYNTFRNNVIYHDGNDWGAGGGSSCGNAMYRVIDSSATGNPCINSTNATFDHGHNTFDNNIFITGSNCTTTGYAVEYSKDYNGGGGMAWLATDTWRNNIFYVEGGGNWSTHFLLGRKVTDWSTDFTKTWAEYLAGAYVSTNTVNSDPKVVATSPTYYASPTLMDLSLQSTSPARNTGYVTGAPLYDIRGVDHSGSPSIGAYKSRIPIIAHTPHFPSISNTLTTYGLSNEPAGLLAGIKAFVTSKFDRIISGTYPTTAEDGHFQWLSYQEMAVLGGFTYLYGLQDFVIARGYNFEDMFLHSSIDTQFVTSWWDHTQQFNYAENTGPYASTATKGVWNYASGTYTDVTALSYSGSGYITISDTLYCGYMEPFDQMNFNVSTGRVGGSVAYQYWNGTTWATLTPQSDATTGLSVTGLGKVYFYPPSDWATTTVNGSKIGYWVRTVVAGASTNPIYRSVVGDNWAVSSGTNNSRGWSTTDSNRINIGTRLEYNTNPPASQSARFRYQARVPGVWSQNYMFLNHAYMKDGIHPVGKYHADKLNTEIDAAATVGMMMDDATTFPRQSLVTSPANWTTYLYDRDQTISFDLERQAEYVELQRDLQLSFGYNLLTGANTVWNDFAIMGEYSIAESSFYSSYAMASTNYYYNVLAGGTSSYDWFLPAHNPNGSQVSIMCYDTPLELVPGTTGNITQWYYWDRGNRAPINCLAQHYLGANAWTGFTYYTQAGFNYYDSDEVFTYNTPTTLTSPVPSDTSSSTKYVYLADATGCTGTTYLRLGSLGSIVSGTLSGLTFTTTSKIYNSYNTGDIVTCIMKNHQSVMSPTVDNVWKWSTWFPAMGVDIGVPDTGGLSGGARVMPWKTAGSPDYISGLGVGCDGHNCCDLNRRDYTNAMVLTRGFSSDRYEPELSTYSTSVALGGTYYPLKADGTTSAGVTSISLRGGEGAILMKYPIGGPPASTNVIKGTIKGTWK